MRKATFTFLSICIVIMLTSCSKTDQNVQQAGTQPNTIRSSQSEEDGDNAPYLSEKPDVSEVQQKDKEPPHSDLPEGNTTVPEQETEKDGTEQSEEKVDELPEQTGEEMSFDEKIRYIRKVYQDTEDRLDELTFLESSEHTVTHYEGDMIRKIVAEPGAYQDLDMDDNMTAEYYYMDDIPLFVFVYGDEKEYRYYLDPTQLWSCIRVIDSDGSVFDYPDGTRPENVTEADRYFTLCYMELHWAGIY